MTMDGCFTLKGGLTMLALLALLPLCWLYVWISDLVTNKRVSV